MIFSGEVSATSAAASSYQPEDDITEIVHHNFIADDIDFVAYKPILPTVHQGVQCSEHLYDDGTDLRDCENNVHTTRT